VTLSGATSASLTLDNIDPTKAGTYQVTVTNAVGIASSAAARLTILSPPVIVTDLTNQFAPPGTDVSFTIGVSGSGPLGFQWFFNETNALETTSSTLTLSNVSASVAGTYYVVAANAYGSATSSVAMLTVSASPIILANLTNMTVLAGSTVTLEVEAEGSGPLLYQWFFNGSTLSAGNGNTLTLNNVTAANAGTYQVAVSNSSGFVLSDPATVTVVSPPAIGIDLTNMTAVSGASVVFQVQASGTGPLSYQWLWNGTVVPGATSNSLALTSVTGQQAGTYQVVVQNAFGTAESAEVSLNVVASNTLRIDPANAGQFKLTFAGVAGQTYTVQSSTNFTASWIKAGTATADSSGTVVYLAPPSGPSTFYRIAPIGRKHP
jgi:hypothetical protein